jgi:hypothetical protein
VRRALQMAVDNETVLELGYNDLGAVAENHHVARSTRIRRDGAAPNSTPPAPAR